MGDALTVPYPPSGNRYWRHVGPKVLLSAEARAYRNRVALLCASKRVRPLDGPVVLSVTVFRPRKAGDLDNALKILIDSLRGFLFHDDAQVVEIHARREDDKADPRAVVRVEASP